MVYFAANAVSPAAVAGGPQAYFNPYYKASCGCGSSFPQVTMNQQGVRENFTPSNGGASRGQGQAIPMPVPMPMPMPMPMPQAPAAPMCTLTATAPPAGCCHPAPLHCDCCNGSG